MLRVLWISSASNGAAVELLQECKRLCEVRTCLPARALAALPRTQPEAVIFDFQDPVAAELQVLQSVKRLYPSVPIVMITEGHSEELAVWAFRTRVWNYLVKPVPLRELQTNLQQIAKVLGHREPGAREIQRPGTMMPRAPLQAADEGEAAVMRRIIENIRRDHTTKIRVSELARACHMSRYSFSRLFHRTFGCSFRDYVMRQRIATACKMLEASDSTVTDIAIASGFSDASYFARMFRRHMRKSPKEYARQAPKPPKGGAERRATL